MPNPENFVRETKIFDPADGFWKPCPRHSELDPFHLFVFFDGLRHTAEPSPPPSCLELAMPQRL
jgi:hypothetical protein